ncbi:MAG: hypothetical protein PHS33_09230, partial [Candidatus Omnitrophica bacterium]|nr:hypothetical protein [Candidatus Omnitrophota bacterium]
MAYASKKNFAKGTLAGAIDDDDLAFSLQSNEGLLFPDTGSGNYFWGVFWGTSHSSPFKDTSREIVKCYRDANDDFVITARGEEGTTPKAWDSGDNFMLSLTAGTIEEIESGTLSLDQTTPQTIINGIPLLEDGHAEFTEQHQIVDKEYVDMATATIGARFFMLDAADDDIAAYKQTSLTTSALGTATVSASVNAVTDTLIEEWVSPAGYNWVTLQPGVYDLNVFVEKTAGNREVRVFWRLYERKTDTSEVLIATSNLGDLVTTKEKQRIFATLSTEYTPDAGSRIVGKVYFRTYDGSQNTTCVLYYQGNEDSHWQIPVSQDFLDGNYLRLDGGTMTGDILGAVSLGATGTRITKLWATNAEITNLPTINGGTLATALNLGTAAYTATGDYEASGAIATHAALQNVHGLAITADKTLTVQDNVTITGALGTGAYATIADYATLATPVFTSKITMGVAAGATGSLELVGTTSGVVTIKVADIAGT